MRRERRKLSIRRYVPRFHSPRRHHNSKRTAAAGSPQTQPRDVAEVDEEQERGGVRAAEAGAAGGAGRQGWPREDSGVSFAQDASDPCVFTSPPNLREAEATSSREGLVTGEKRGCLVMLGRLVHFIKKKGRIPTTCRV